jgi:hypothetical protein
MQFKTYVTTEPGVLILGLQWSTRIKTYLEIYEANNNKNECNKTGIKRNYYNRNWLDLFSYKKQYDDFPSLAGIHKL